MNRPNRRSQKGNRNPRPVRAKKISQTELMNLLQKEGKEKIMIVAATARLKIPKPLHTKFRTRQEVLFPNISTGITSGGSTQMSYIAQATPGALVFGAMAFSLQDLDQVTSFTSLFDQYRIDRVIVQVKTHNNFSSFNTSSAANSAPPTTFWVIDRDDSNALTTLAQARQYDNVQDACLTDHVEIDLEPSVTPAIYAAGAFSGYGITRTGVWLDCNNVSIPHYGVKFAITELTALATDTYFWDIEFYYYVSFRNVR